MMCVCFVTWSHSVAMSPSRSCFSWTTICFSSYSCSNMQTCNTHTSHLKWTQTHTHTHTHAHRDTHIHTCSYNFPLNRKGIFFSLIFAVLSFDSFGRSFIFVCFLESEGWRWYLFMVSLA